MKRLLQIGCGFAVSAAACLHAEFSESVRDALLAPSLDPLRDIVDDTGQPDGTRAILQALLLLSEPTRTPRGIQQAEALLEPLSAKSDADGMLSAYLLARIADVHRPESDPGLALARYDAVIAKDPAHPLSQIAVVRRSIVDIYSVSDDPLAAVDRAEASLATLDDPSAQRDLSIVLGRSLLFLNGDASRARAHLERALELGLTDRLNRSGTRVAVAELAARQGDAESARTHYERFLAEFPRDQRVNLIKERLASLSQQ